MNSCRAKEKGPVWRETRTPAIVMKIVRVKMESKRDSEWSSERLTGRRKGGRGKKKRGKTVDIKEYRKHKRSNSIKQ